MKIAIHLRLINIHEVYRTVWFMQATDLETGKAITLNACDIEDF